MAGLILKGIFVTALLCGLLACSDGSSDAGNQPQAEELTAAQLLRQRMGAGADYFSDEAMAQLLTFDELSRPVTLLQLIEVTHAQGFAAYLAEVEPLWQAVGASGVFDSTVSAQLIGDRVFSDVRAIEFPTVTLLIEVMNTPAFTSAMNTLFAASGDHAWVLGYAQDLPFEAAGSYDDPALKNLDREQAVALLSQSSPTETRFKSNPEVILDMLVSDSREPFWMVNLIDFYEQAQYADGRESGLTGMEANEIYGQSILPLLLAYNSFPALVVPVDIVLTRDAVGWEQAAIVRYASRDAFLNAFPLNPHSGEALEHKEAGVENTLVLVTEKAGRL